MFGYHKYYTIIQISFRMGDKSIDDEITEFHMIPVIAKNPFKAIPATIRKMRSLQKELLLDDMLITDMKLYSKPFSKEEWEAAGKEKYESLSRQYKSYIKI